MEKTITLKPRCPECGIINDVTVSIIGYHNYKSGMLIQDALPELNPVQREMLITGICGKCWNKMFDDSDEL